MELPTAPPPLAEPRLEKSQAGSNGSSNGAQAGQHGHNASYHSQNNANGAARASSFEWQSDKDMELRHCIMHHIVKLLKNQQKVKQSASGNNKKANDEWHAMLPSMVKQLEFSLYKRAKSRREYMDLNTLKSRLSELANEIHERTKAARRGGSRPSEKREVPSSFHANGGASQRESSSSSSHQRLVNPSDINPNLSSTSLSQQNHSDKNQLDKDRLRYRQQRLLMLHHSSKCTADPCDVTKHCAELKLLWKHLEICPVANARNNTAVTQECEYPHCNSSFLILSHYRNCKVECPVCEPVRKLLRRKKEEAKRVQQYRSSSSGVNSSVQEPSKRVPQAPPNSSLLVPSHSQHSPYHNNGCLPAMQQSSSSSHSIAQGMMNNSSAPVQASSRSNPAHSFSTNSDVYDRSLPPQASPIVRQQSHSLPHNAPQEVSSNHYQHAPQQQPSGSSNSNNGNRTLKHSSTIQSTASSSSAVSQEIENQALRVLILRHSIRCQEGSRCHIPACHGFQLLWYVPF